MSPRRRGFDRKQAQLCRQIERAVQHALSWECTDEALQQLVVEGVEPVDDGARLLAVKLRLPASCSEEELLHVRDQLPAIAGFLRGQVAEAINRRKVPELALELAHG